MYTIVYGIPADIILYIAIYMTLGPPLGHSQLVLKVLFLQESWALIRKKLLRS